MLHSFVFAPFADAAAETQFDALHAQLQAVAAAEAGPVLLLGSLPLDDAGPLDAVVVRPAGITLLVFVLGGGSLHLPALGQGPWQLAGQPLAGQGGSANPYAQFQRQRRALAAWLTAQPGLGPVRPEAIGGIALFAQPVTFGSEVEARLNVQSGADHFQLLSSLPHLPRRLQQQAAPSAALPPAALQQWLQHLLAESGETQAAEEAAPAAPDDYWVQKARQLWRWLGAEDIPPDTAYAGYAPDPAAASAAEKERLELVRQQVRAELDQHTQAMSAREVEREQTIRQLQQQLAQASAAAPSTAELQERLAAETREKAALHEAMQLARAESAARNRELDARIEQLGQLIQQLHTRPAAPAAPAASPPPPAIPRPAATPQSAAAPAAPRPAAPRPTVRRYSAWKLQPWRAAALVAVLIGVAASIWALTHLPLGRPKPAGRRAGPARTEVARPEPATPAAEDTPVDAAAAQLEERLNNAVIDSTGLQSAPAPTDSVLPASGGYSDLDSLEEDE